MTENQHRNTLWGAKFCFYSEEGYDYMHFSRDDGKYIFQSLQCNAEKYVALMKRSFNLIKHPETDLCVMDLFWATDAEINDGATVSQTLLNKPNYASDDSKEYYLGPDSKIRNIKVGFYWDVPEMKKFCENDRKYLDDFCRENDINSEPPKVEFQLSSFYDKYPCKCPTCGASIYPGFLSYYKDPNVFAERIRIEASKWVRF